MNDIKTQHSWAADDFWPQLGMVTVAGDNTAQSFPAGASQQEGERTIQTWSKVAVLHVNPDVPVYWGYMVGETHAQFLNQPVETMEGQFGVRVGDGKVTFFVIPVDLKARPKLELVEVVNINDSRYAELPLY